MSEVSPLKTFAYLNNIRKHLTQKEFNVSSGLQVNAYLLKKFETSPDKKLVTKIAQHRYPHKYILSNLIVNPKMGVKSFNEDNYSRFRRAITSLSRTYENDIVHLLPTIKANLDGIYPPLLQMIDENVINIESAMIFIQLIKADDYWKPRVKNKQAKEKILLIRKYSMLYELNLDKYRAVTYEHFTS